MTVEAIAYGAILSAEAMLCGQMWRERMRGHGGVGIQEEIYIYIYMLF